MAIALMHFGLPKRYKWAAELPALSGFNRHMFKVQFFFVAFNTFIMGVICLALPQVLVEKSLAGLVLSVWMTVYWSVRLWCQFFVYPKELWQGKRFETAMHILFALIWIFIVATMGSALAMQLKSSFSTS